MVIFFFFFYFWEGSRDYNKTWAQAKGDFREANGIFFACEPGVMTIRLSVHTRTSWVASQILLSVVIAIDPPISRGENRIATSHVKLTPAPEGGPSIVL